jgi:putative solute:sodium symporter small subunit
MALHDADHDDPRRDDARRTHWRALLRRTLLLLAIWFAAGPFLGVLVADRINTFALGGLPLGFWMAQQGAIYVFVVVIFVYAFLADRADADGATGGGTVPPGAPGSGGPPHGAPGTLGGSPDRTGGRAPLGPTGAAG